MAAVDPQGEMQNWESGFPATGINVSSNPSGEMQFWESGFPSGFIFPVSGSVSLIKTVNGVVIASVKTIGSLAIASVKSKNGVLNV